MQTAYKGERKYTAKYVAFSKKAEEGVFQKIVLSQNVYSAPQNIRSINHQLATEVSCDPDTFIKPKYPVKPTKENLKNDIKGEAFEVNLRYPDFLKTAKIAYNHIVSLSFSYLKKTKQKHKFAFKQALIDINSNTLKSVPFKYFVCSSCGHTYTKASKHCDFSFTDRDKFIVFE